MHPQGSEYEILVGARELLVRHLPVVMYELDDTFIMGGEPRSLLLRLGYKCKSMDGDVVCHVPMRARSS